MNKRFMGLGMLAALLFAAAPVLAQGVDQRIQSLEQELTQLKEQQIELKKEATAAAAALPTFSYRPGNGLNIEAADKSWALRSTLEAHARMYFMEGKDQLGRTQGEIELRRFRPGWFFCIDNCLWEIEATLDLDGFDGNSVLQRGQVNFHAENLNPFLPTVAFGGDVSTSMGTARQGSSAIGSQADYDLLSRNDFNTGSSGFGIVLNWDDRSLSGIGIPGRITRYQIAYSVVGKGGDDVQTNTDKKDISTFLGIQPFSQIKNKWISGLQLEMGAWFCHIDDRTTSSTTNGNCNRLRLRENDNAGKATMFDSGTLVGRGLHTFLMPGLLWTVGPYRLRVAGGFSEYDGGNNAAISQTLKGDPRGRMFLIGHDLFLWSPKGFFTGSPQIPGSILFGTHFERNDASVDCGGSATCLANVNGGEYHRARVLLREWDLWYFTSPRMSVGVHFEWYDSSNLRTGRNNAQGAIFNRNPGTPGRGGDWINTILNWRYTF